MMNEAQIRKTIHEFFSAQSRRPPLRRRIRPFVERNKYAPYLRVLRGQRGVGPRKKLNFSPLPLTQLIKSAMYIAQQSQTGE